MSGAIDPTFPMDLRDIAWGSTPWPEWLTGLRPQQADAIMACLEHFLDGVDVVMLNAPTGSGKTLIAEALRRLMGVEQTLYVATTIQLQEQMLRDFPYAKLLKGRSNYPTLDKPDLFRDRWQKLSAADCHVKRTRLPACVDCHVVTDENERVSHCDFCHPVMFCPYQVAKREAFAAELAVTNTAYFLAEANGIGQFSGWPFTVVDEADSLERILMGQIEVNISERRRLQLEIEFPEFKTKESSWLPWVEEEAIPKVEQAIRWIPDPPTEITDRRELVSLNRLHDRLERLAEVLTGGNAVYDGYARGDIIFKPVHVNRYAGEMLWRHSQRFLLMSATLDPPMELVQSLGIEEAGKRWAVVNVPSTFPVENRPVIIRNAANMTHKTRDQEWPKLVETIRWILEKTPGRTLIHSVSYELTQYIFDGIRDMGRPVVVHSSAAERSEALRIYKGTEGAVMVTPSMERGVDLIDDLARCVIIAKVPWPNTKDKQIEKRLYTTGGQLWLKVQVARTIVQATGRGVRSETDQCVTWILDAQFMKLYKRNRALFPAWWSDALDMTGGVALGLA